MGVCHRGTLRLSGEATIDEESEEGAAAFRLTIGMLSGSRPAIRHRERTAHREVAVAPPDFTDRSHYCHRVELVG
jgi:hypothetical protein